MKIVSLVPSLTELLFDLGLEEQIVGRTKFCIHPAGKARLIPKIGGTKNVNISKINDLSPDIILANKEENTKEQVLELSKKYDVLLTEIATYDEALSEISRIGTVTKRESEAQSIIKSIEQAFSFFPIHPQVIRVCYLIWQKPYMTIGNDTYIHDMLHKCGYENIFGDQTRYPAISVDEIKNVNPEYVFLSSEPFPFKQRHIDELQLELPNTKIILVNGEYFSWYGSRMIGAAGYFKAMEL